MLLHLPIAFRNHKTQLEPSCSHLLKTSQVRSVVGICSVWFFGSVKASHPARRWLIRTFSTDEVRPLRSPPHIELRFGFPFEVVLLAMAVVKVSMPGQCHLLRKEA